MDILLETAAIVNDRYLIKQQLGQGGFSRTYLAEDTHRFNELCVIKEFAPQNRDPEIRSKAEELFEREAKVLYKLEHPQIPRFRAVFRLQKVTSIGLFLVQDYIEGLTYRELLNLRLSEGKTLTEGEIIELLEKILPVLDYLHAQGIIHRDIAPDNLIYRQSDKLPVLIDFGSVKQIDTVSNGSVTAPIVTQLGKMGYAPDEQIQEGIVFSHSDLYALAVTVLVLLSGKEPSQLKDKETEQWQWREQIALSPKISQILTKMLVKQPSNRFQTVQEVLASLNQADTQFLEAQPTIIVAPPPVTKRTNQAPGETPGDLSSPSEIPAKETMALISSPKYNPVLGCFGKILLIMTIIMGSGLLGWIAGKIWLKQAIHLDTTTTPVPVFTPSPQDDTNSPPATFEEDPGWQRKETLRTRRQQLGINDRFFQKFVEQVFSSKYPEQAESTLDDARWQEKRDEVATELLEKLSSLSEEARQGLGSYEQQQRNSWKQQVNQLHLSSRALYDLADAAFFNEFPEQENEQFDEQAIEQVYSANVLNTLKALQSGEAYEQVIMLEGTEPTQLQGNLEPGKGKAYVVRWQEGQQLELKLETDESTQISVYSPTGNNNLLEDSTLDSWSGTLPESGYYEIIVVSKSDRALNYQLNLQVNQSE